MATKIILCSDNHGYIDPINQILNDNQFADYYIHCGDLCFDPVLAKPFLVVSGNNDFYYELDRQRILEIENNRILVFHGTGYTYSLNLLVDKAKDNNCNVVFFGHTHSFFNETYKGIRLINPGSCWRNRDGSNPCYALITIDNDSIDVQRVDLENI